MSNIGYGFIVFMVLLGVSLILLRIGKKYSPPTILCLSSLVVYILGAIFIISFYAPLKFFEFSASYWFFSFGMMMVFFAVYKSISLRMMMHLQNKPATLDSILSEYIQQESYTVRLNILVQNGFVKVCPEGYQLTLKGKRYGNIVLFVQKIFGINQSG